MNIIETYRSAVVGRLMSTPSFHVAWPTMRDSLLSRLPTAQALTAQDLFDLGDHISDAFRAVGGDRGQSALTRAGTNWESLVSWYLNVCLCGTNAVAFKGYKRLIPDSIDSALTVNYGNRSLRSETDLLIVYVDGDQLQRGVADTSQAIDEYRTIVTSHFQSTSVINVQCKTNWNDIAQIPMLWNLVYSPNFSHPTVTIGRGVYHIRNLRAFKYAFVTVPSQELSKFSPTCLPVLRVNTLSGGAYWGRPTVNRICSSIKEIFVNNQAGNCLPNVNRIGAGYVKAVQGRSSSVDWQAFNLY